MKHLKRYEYFDYDENDNYDEDDNYDVSEYDVDDIVMVNPDNDNDNYDEFRNKPLRIIHKATNTTEHPGYDDSIKGQGLYDLEDEKTGELIDSSLYDYELVPY